MERLKQYLPKNKTPHQILQTDEPRYIEHIEEQVVSADGHRRYDLLIEYGIYHPSHGIYFGCRYTMLPGHHHTSETIVALKEWNAAGNGPETCHGLDYLASQPNFNPEWTVTHDEKGEYSVKRGANRRRKLGNAWRLQWLDG